MSQEIYQDGEYAAKFPTWHAEDSSWKAAHLSSLVDDQILREFCERNSPLRVAEVGCGAGGVIAGVCENLHSRGVNCEMTGYDISDFARQIAALKNPQIRFFSDFWDDEDCYELGLMVIFLNT